MCSFAQVHFQAAGQDGLLQFACCAFFRRDKGRAECWVMVLPADSRPRSMFLSMATRMPCQSKPWCSQKVLSSATMTARRRFGEMRLRLRQVQLTFIALFVLSQPLRLPVFHKGGDSGIFAVEVPHGRPDQVAGDIAAVEEQEAEQTENNGPPLGKEDYFFR